MTTKNSDVLLSLYGEPRSVVHSRVSVRGKKDDATETEEIPTEKIGQAMVSLTSLKEEPETAR